MDQLDEETNETHDGETDRGGDGDLLELPLVWLGASLDETDGVLGELAARLNEQIDLVHD